MKESHREGFIHPPLNSTFLALIPKKDSPGKFEDFRPTSLCNSIYNIISKIIDKILKEVLSTHISKEQFGFLDGRQIHEAVGVAQEGLHSIKTKHLKGEVLKIDLSKAYDRVNWLYIRLLLTRLGFHIDFIKWIMCCISSVSFTILINGATSPFFHVEHGLKQGCPLSPLLFLLVAEGLSHFLKKAFDDGDFKGIPISLTLTITHLLFVDDILIFCDGSLRSLQVLCQGLNLFHTASGMVINDEKSTISWANLSEDAYRLLGGFFRFPSRVLDEGFKYLGFYLKPNALFMR